MRHSLLVIALFLTAAPSIANSLPPSVGKALEKGDYKKAFAEVSPLAAQGNADAQFLMGMFYDSGNGVAQDQAQAASWYRRAADQKHLVAQLFLGVLYYSGQGVKQDYAQALHWFQGPAESGNDQAQYYLGAMYAQGTGVAMDDDKAIEWLTKSAAQRNTRAMGALAPALLSRARDDQDLVDAYVWSHLAAELDPVQAMTAARGVMEKHCTKEQRKRAEKAMAEWKRRWAKE